MTVLDHLNLNVYEYLNVYNQNETVLDHVNVHEYVMTVLYHIKMYIIRM